MAAPNVRRVKVLWVRLIHGDNTFLADTRIQLTMDEKTARDAVTAVGRRCAGAIMCDESKLVVRDASSHAPIDPDVDISHLIFLPPCSLEVVIPEVNLSYLHQQLKSSTEQQAVLWSPDKAVPSCEKCSTLFGLFLRRHHCRMCGGLFCCKCSTRSVLMGGHKRRACDACFAKVAQSIMPRTSNASSPAVHPRPSSLSTSAIDPGKRDLLDSIMW